MPTVAKDVGQSFSVCERCGYASGFHVSFDQVDGDHDVVLIGPSCGQQYSINWKVRL